MSQGYASFAGQGEASVLADACCLRWSDIHREEIRGHQIMDLSEVFDCSVTGGGHHGWGPSQHRGMKVKRRQKTLSRVLGGGSDADIWFSDLIRLLRYLGFTERVKGSHHIFVRQGVTERIVLQRDGSHAKAYQVRQIRRILRRRILEEEQ